MTNGFSDIQTLLTNSDVWIVRLHFIACAERSFPLIMQLALDRSIYICREVLDEAWEAASIQLLRQSFESQYYRLAHLPEALATNPITQAYAALGGVSLLVTAIATLLTDDVQTIIENGSSDIETNTAELDEVIQRINRQKFDLSDHEIFEEMWQLDFLFQQHKLSRDVVGIVKRRAEIAAIRYNEALKACATLMKWDLNYPDKLT